MCLWCIVVTDYLIMNNDLMFSSEKQNWATRWETFNSIERELGVKYNLDPCAEKDTTKCERFITKEDDVFTIDNPLDIVGGEEVRFFANPEYGRAQINFVKHFVKWCDIEGVSGDVLIPAKTETNLFHNIILPKAKKVYFIEKRITFGTDNYWEWLWEQEYKPCGKKKNTLYKKYGRMDAAPFPSMLVSFDGSDNGGMCEFGVLQLDKCKYQGNKSK